MGRPPLSNDRLSLAPDGHRLTVTLKTHWRDGTSQIVLTPFELMERLVAIVPPPRKNLIRYHGCFGPKCPKCPGQLKVISFILDDKPIPEILTSLKMATAPPNIQAESSWHVDYDDGYREGPNYLNDEYIKLKPWAKDRQDLP